ncbi:MAG: hypothetical protein EON90_00500 [Brevundimonas sp.]|nr:MAG: hypothetical protein EON90_00500 [Brevundimonas sp.]
MTNVYATPEKAQLRRGLLHLGLQTLRGQGYAVRRSPGSGARQVYEAAKGDETLRIAVRTSQDTWFAFPRLADDSGWLTLDEVDWVLVASIDTPHQPTEARVHWMPADDVRARFEQGYRARLAAGHAVPLGRGLWLSLYDPNASSPVSHVGGGFGLDYPPIATCSLSQVLEELPAPGAALAIESEPDEDFEPDLKAPAFDLLEAKRMIARGLGLSAEAIRITIDI